MTRVLITCPVTGHGVFTGIEMDDEEFENATLTDETLKLYAACAQTHAWSKQDAYLES